jgi:NTE family protein
MYSPSNLDLLRDEGLDLVICLNPTSSLDEIPVTSPLRRMAAAVRGASGRRLGSEARRVREGGAQVLLVQPTREDVEAMGPNLMSGRNRHKVVLTAGRTTVERLREPEARDALAGLPAGSPHKLARPDGPPSSWPELDPVSPA